MSTVTSAWADTLDRYWSIFEVEEDVVDSVVAEVFTDDARLESAALPACLVGRSAIADRMRSVRRALHGVSVRHVTEAECAHRTARWCWAASNTLGTRRGMDVARFTEDGTRIELLVVFAGLLPPPS